MKKYAKEASLVIKRLLVPKVHEKRENFVGELKNS